ncbi:MAG: hypothetical protein ACYDCH_07025 [Gaiellaceae bacterium]
MSVSNSLRLRLAPEYAAKLSKLAARAHAEKEDLACALLSQAIDEVDADGQGVAALLDAIPGAWERAKRGLGESAAGRTVPAADV